LSSKLKHFINPQTEQGEVFSPGLREIVTKYKGECSKCRDPIPVGSKAWYGQNQKGARPILVCLNCMVLGMSDRALAKKYLKAKELQAIIRGLRKEADELCKKLFDPNFLKRNEEYQRTLNEAISRYEGYLKASTPAEEREILEKLLAALKNGSRIEKGVDDFLYLQLQRLSMFNKKKAVV